MLERWYGGLILPTEWCFSTELALTKHCHLRRLAVPLSHHVGTHADVHASIALSCVGDHQLPSSNLKERA